MAIRSLYPQKKKADKYDEDEESKYEDSDEDEEDSDDEDSDEDDSDNDDSYEDSDEEENEEDSDDEDTLDGGILDAAYYCNAEPCPFNSTGTRAGVRIISCKNGKRIELSKKILSALGGPSTISFLYAKGYLILAFTDEHTFPLRGKKRNTVYSAALVDELTSVFSLDFSDCTCLSFPDFKSIDDDSVLAVAVTMK